MSVNMLIQFQGRQLTLPINPEELTITKSADNTKLDIIGLGKAIRKAEPGLESFSIESFFPGSQSYFYTGVNPSTCVNFINDIFQAENSNNNVARIVTVGLPVNINTFVVIDSFEYTHKAGEEEDIYFKLEVTRYTPYGVRTVASSLSGLAAARSVSSVTPPVAQPQTKTYTVKKGDCLWKITKNFTGNGSRWRELYNINKDVVGRNPNLIYPNQVLTLPEGW